MGRESRDHPRDVSVYEDEDLNISQGEHSWATGRGCLCQVPKLGEKVVWNKLRWRQWREKLLEKSHHVRGISVTSSSSPPLAALLP